MRGVVLCVSCKVIEQDPPIELAGVDTGDYASSVWRDGGFRHLIK